MSEDAIAAELRRLTATTATVSPFNYHDPSSFDRGIKPVELSQRRKTGPLTKNLSEIENIIKKSERLLNLAEDPEVRSQVRDIEFSERSMKLAAEGVPDYKPRKKGADAPKPLPAVYKPSKVAALSRLGNTTFETETRSQYAFSDEIKDALATRDSSACMKMDDFKAYTAELVKWQNMEKLVVARKAGGKT